MATVDGGNYLATRDGWPAARHSLSSSVMDQLRQDVYQALRALRASPGVSGVAIVTLAIGIGANTAIFSAVSALLLRPLPIPNIDRVVYGVSLREGFDPFGSGLVEYESLRASVHELAATGAATSRTLNLTSRTDPERVTVADVTASYFDVLETRPLQGRRFEEADDRPGAAPVALAGYDFWRRHFGDRQDVVGQTLTTDEGVLTIVGVMPEGFDQPDHAELWLPARLPLGELPIDRRVTHNWEVVARLRDGARLAAANASARATAERIQTEYPQYRRGWSYELIPLRRQLINDFDGRSGRALTLLTATVVFLLLICCANVAGLLLMRGVARQREIAVRLALGAGRTRVGRQLFTESAVVAAMSALAGLLLASWALPVVAAFNPIHAAALSSSLADFRIDWRVLVFTMTVSASATVAFGLLPALRTSGSGDLTTVLKRREQRTRGDAVSRKWLSALVIGEIAVAATMLVGASLVVQSFDRLRRVDLGFLPDRVLTAQLALAPTKYASQTQRAAFVTRLVGGIRSLPGVEAAGASTNLPLDDLSFDSAFAVEGRAPRQASEVPITSHRLVTPGYLETLNARLLQGRLIGEHDTADASPVVVVTEEFAKQAWPGDANPIGRRVRRIGWEQRESPWLTVVGVIANVKEDQFNFRINRPAWYLSYAQADSAIPVNVIVRTRADAASLAGSIRGVVRAIDPAQPIGGVRLLSDQVVVVMGRDRFSAALVSALGGIGVLLAAVGLYGAMAYSVSQRRAEFAVRVALGATPADLRQLVLGQARWLLVAGLVIGLAVARGLAAAIGAVLYDVRPGDPLTFAGVAAILALVGFLASYLPARRAARIDPAIGLRNE